MSWWHNDVTPVSVQMCSCRSPTCCHVSLFVLRIVSKFLPDWRLKTSLLSPPPSSPHPIQRPSQTWHCGTAVRRTVLVTAAWTLMALYGGDLKKTTVCAQTLLRRDNKMGDESPSEVRSSTGTTHCDSVLIKLNQSVIWTIREDLTDR